MKNEKSELGRVKWFNNEKGFGFISGGDSKEIFVHYSQINSEGYKTLAEGDAVEYELCDTAKGMQAKNVKKTFHD